MKSKFVYMLVLFLGFFGCIEDDSLLDDEVEGYKPVYSNTLDYEITFLDSQPIETPGKIYVYGNFLFVNDRLKGVHVINNSDPANPVNLGFISIPGNVDIAVSDYVLYADNHSDLVAIDISNINNLQVCDREKGVFLTFQDYPDVAGTYFECVDHSKGVVVGWTQTTIHKPKCYR